MSARRDAVTLFGVSLRHDDVVRAINAFDRKYEKGYDNWLSKNNYKFALRYRGKLYPPKRILSLASGLKVREFSGGSPTNDLLRSLGFEVIDKPGAH